MIVEYHRPQNLDAAVQLLQRPAPRTVPLGGGTIVNQHRQGELAVVDLQALKLNQVEFEGNTVKLGATVTLAKLIEIEGLPAGIAQAARKEVSNNLRQMATLAGSLVSADGRSPLATAFLALDAQLTWLPGEIEVYLGNWMPVREFSAPGLLIESIQIPTHVRLVLESVARTPGDKPVVCAAVASWPSGRTRVALGGYGKMPILVMDGTESEGGEAAARAAYSQAEDAWASASFRQDIAGVLVARCLSGLKLSGLNLNGLKID
jgi:CO/xanthine dehydrogenase FAD-binding subunit